MCDKFQSISANKTINITSYLCLNIAHFYEPSIYFKNLDKKQRESYNLEEIPKNLDVLNKKFILCGVIEFVPPVLTKGVGHYVAYTRSLNNTWTQINDIESKSKVFSPNTREIRVVLLFYVLV